MGDLDCDVLVDIDTRLSAGETVPDCIRALSIGALDCDLAFDGLTVGGRMVFLLAVRPLPGRGSPAMLQYRLLNVMGRRKVVYGLDEEVNKLGLIPRAKHLFMQ